MATRRPIKVRPPTEGEARALTILRDDGPLMARGFAERMWPDAEGWNKVTRCGPYGVTRGGQMNGAGGAYLAKLRQRGWADSHRRQWRLTADGWKAIESAGKPGIGGPA